MGILELKEFLLSNKSATDRYKNRERRYVLENIAACRSPQLGGRLCQCPNCGTWIVFYNACHQRGCPVCAQETQRKWRMKMQARLLPVDHYHLTFNGPEELTVAWRHDPKRIIDSLFRAVDQTLKLESRRSGLRFGVVLQFHSHAAGMGFKAHMHCMVTAGGLDENGKWHSHRFADERTLRENFRRLALAELSDLPLRGDYEALRQKPWRVYSVRHPGNADDLLRYFSRSLHGLLIDAEEEFSVSEETVRFTMHHLNGSRQTTLEKEEFLQRYFQHIPPKGTVTVRHYGLYATRNTTLLTAARFLVALLPKPKQEKRTDRQTMWLCPVCSRPLKITREFTGEELPPIVLNHERVRGSPPAHGEIIQSVQVSP